MSALIEQAFTGCQHLLLAGSPASLIQTYCVDHYGYEPSPSTLRKWRDRVGVPSRAPKLPCRKGHPVGQIKPYCPFTPEEIAQMQGFNRLISFMKPTRQIAA